MKDIQIPTREQIQNVRLAKHQLRVVKEMSARAMMAHRQALLKHQMQASATFRETSYEKTDSCYDSNTTRSTTEVTQKCGGQNKISIVLSPKPQLAGLKHSMEVDEELAQEEPQQKIPNCCARKSAGRTFSSSSLQGLKLPHQLISGQSP